MFLAGQAGFRLHSIPSSVERILWINVTAPSLGDALMDTSGRVLLRGRIVSLLTHPKNASLFEHEPDFETVWSITPENLRKVSGAQFDLVILDSFSPKSLAVKIKVARQVPFVGLYGFLNAFEVHRTIYSFRRLEKLLGLAPTSQPTLSLKRGNSTRRQSINQALCIAFAIGGEWGFRTYPHWSAVLKELVGLKMRLVLLGSSNGMREAEALMVQFGSAIENRVGQTSLHGLIEALPSFDLFVGADGGLWHIASACGVPSVALHADCELYDEMGDWHSRAGKQPECIPLRANQSVSEISPEAIVRAIKVMLTKLRS